MTAQGEGTLWFPRWMPSNRCRAVGLGNSTEAGWGWQCESEILVLQRSHSVAACCFLQTSGSSPWCQSVCLLRNFSLGLCLPALESRFG